MPNCSSSARWVKPFSSWVINDEGVGPPVANSMRRKNPENTLVIIRCTRLNRRKTAIRLGLFADRTLASNCWDQSELGPLAVDQSYRVASEPFLMGLAWQITSFRLASFGVDHS